VRRMFHGILLIVAVLAAVPSSAGALLWIEPQPGLPQPGETVRLRLVHGEFVDDSPGLGAVGEVARYQRIWNSGRANLLLDSGNAESARFRVAEAGTQLVVLSTRPLPDKRGAGRTTYFCKAFVIAGTSEGSGQLHFSEVGQRLEIIPQTDPAALAGGGGLLEIQVLFEREPLAGAVVRAVHREPGRQKGQQATTDEIGLARLRLDRSGEWLISVEHRVRCSDCGPDGSERLVGTLYMRGGGS